MITRSIVKDSARSRHAVLMSSAAALALVTVSGAANAQSGVSGANFDGIQRVSEASIGTLDRDDANRVPQIVTSDPVNTPANSVDPVDITGVGQMVVDTQDGFIGLCTGTLINPRTVILAAHCVNEQPATNYGASSGGTPIGFGFSSYTLPGIRSWYRDGPNQYQTNTALAFYNANQVKYNIDSTQPAAQSFLYSDIATATLDTPAAGIPTWALLFSQLPQPTEITAAGTGYHVTLDGYGTNGTGTTGDIGGIDYRRRLADNTLGALASLDDFEGFLFGATEGLPQNLYFIDFDDPRRGTAAASPYDFNAWRDNATAKEGTTAPGDSGGPLILDQAFAKAVVIGVLSGGYSQFFEDQPSDGYGTVSFYQPLYLYWDFIAANNPYHYVSSLAGNGKWSDPSHWVSNLDPNYQVLVNGQLVNGIPTTPGGGTTDTSGKFGQTCFQSNGVSDCYDVATGTETVEEKPIGTAASDPAKVATGALSGSATNDAATVAASSLGSDSATVAAGTGSDAAAAAADALPAATLANGLPGATNFVPQDYDGDRLTGTAARYFDVTLNAAGTTTLDTTVTVDEFRLNGAKAVLDITSAGSLTSLIDVTQALGLIHVDGKLTTPGDYLLLSGVLEGSGTITTPYLTSIAGILVPGSAGTIGKLTVAGNLVMGNGTLTLIDLGANGASDKIAVTATTYDGTTPTNGIVDVGGAVAFGDVSGAKLRQNDVFTILTGEGGRIGTFSASSTFITAILKPTLIYTANAVQVRLDAGLYADVVAGGLPVETAYAQLLDQNRGRYSRFSNLYGPLDAQNASTIVHTFDSLAPKTETLIRALGTTAVDNMSRFYRDRLSNMDVVNGLGGSLALIGQPLQLAAVSASGRPGGEMIASDTPDMTLRPGALPESMSGFIAGGYLNGSSRPMPRSIPYGGRDQFDGYYIAAGIETELDGQSAIGLSGSYTKTDGNTRVAGQTARGELMQGTIYGKLETLDGIALDVQASAGLFEARTRRSTSIVGTGYVNRSYDGVFAFNSEVGAAKMFDLYDIKIGPRVSLRASHLGFTPTAESGGGPALLYDRKSFDSVQGRAGLVLTTSSGARFRPYASGYYVHDFKDTPGSFGANFVGGVGPNALFALAGQTKNWGEISGGVAFGTEKIELSLGADTSIGRKDVQNQSYRGSVTLRF